VYGVVRCVHARVCKHNDKNHEKMTFFSKFSQSENISGKNGQMIILTKIFSFGECFSPNFPMIFVSACVCEVMCVTTAKSFRVH